MSETLVLTDLLSSGVFAADLLPRESAASFSGLLANQQQALHEHDDSHDLPIFGSLDDRPAEQSALLAVSLIERPTVTPAVPSKVSDLHIDSSFTSASRQSSGTGQPLLVLGEREFLARTVQRPLQASETAASAAQLDKRIAALDPLAAELADSFYDAERSSQDLDRALRVAANSQLESSSIAQALPAKHVAAKLTTLSDDVHIADQPIDDSDELALAENFEAAVDNKAAPRAAVENNSAARQAAPTLNESAVSKLLMSQLTSVSEATEVGDESQMQTSVDMTRKDAPEKLASQIMMMVRNGVRTARIEAHPRDLGSIEIALRLETAGADIDVRASSPELRDYLTDNAPKLKALLEESGIDLSNLDVGTRDRGESESRWREPDDDQQTASSSASTDRAETDTATRLRWTDPARQLDLYV